MEEMFRYIEKKHREDILFVEKQMKMFESLTIKRMEMIRTIRNRHPTSIRQLAQLLDRDVKNVFDDVKLLNKMKIVRLVRMGTRVKPVIKKKVIIINLE